MRRLIIPLLAATALSGAAIVCARTADGHLPPPKIAFAEASQAVPFELFRGNRIVVPARVNGHSTDVILDTGAEATTLDRAFARSIGLHGGTKVRGEGAGGAVEAELFTGVSVDVGGLWLRDMTVAVVDLAPIARAIGRPINAVLGRELFNSAVVSVDWANNRLRISSPAAFKPGANTVAVPLERKGPFHTIPVSIAGGATIHALLDLGNGGALSLPKAYWVERPEIARLPFAQWQLGGVGGMNPARVVSVPKVTLGGRSFDQVPATLSETGNNHDATQMANVGIGLLAQFDVDLDLGRDRLYLRPRSAAPPFDRDRAGARFQLAGDRLKVVFVSPQGPAAAAGLKPGDELVAINGRPVTPAYYSGPDWTRSAAGEHVSLQRSDGSQVELTLRDYY